MNLCGGDCIETVMQLTIIYNDNSAIIKTKKNFSLKL